MAQRLAVVSGASSGIGAATAEALGAAGWRVVLVARRADRLAATAARIDRAGGHGVVAALDAGDADAVLALAAEVRAAYGPPGVLVNAAGAGQWRWLEDTPPDVMERMLDAPFRAAYHLTYAFLPDLLAARQGVVVHVGSPAAYLAWPSTVAYSCARWALRGLHEALAQELGGTGVHSCHVVFGEVTSEYFTANPDSHEHIPAVGRLIPVITPAESAEVIVRTIHRPRHTVFHPPQARWLAAVNQLAPGPSRLVARRTGRRRD